MTGPSPTLLEVSAFASLLPFLLGLIVGVVLGAGGTAAAFHFGQRRSPDPAPAASLLDHILTESSASLDYLEELRQSLRVKFLHDEHKIQDALEFERARAPNATEEELLRAANERWERENR